jgi:hypothetical protein
VLPAWIREDDPALIVSVSTAESATGSSEAPSQNGSVLIGGSFFLYDADPNNPESHLVIPPDKVFIPNNAPQEVFDLLDESFSTAATKRFIPAPRSPAEQMSVSASPESAAIGVINVTDYKKYAKADGDAYSEFARTVPPGKARAASIETTHGVVRLSSEKPILFVSPITDRYLHFKEDVDDSGVQSYIASFNAGITVSDMLVKIDACYNG